MGGDICDYFGCIIPRVWFDKKRNKDRTDLNIKMIELKLIIIVLFASFLGAIGALNIKKSSNKINLKFKSFLNKNLIMGFFLYGISSIMYLYTLKKGELSVMYPLVSTTYIWTTVFSIKHLNEKMNRYKYFGLIAIIFGVGLIGLGS